MYEGATYSLLVERFAKGMKKSMPEDLERNKPLNSLVVNYILSGTKHEWVSS